MEMITQQKSSGELAAASSAALAKATIEAKFTVALHRPRNVMEARSRILEACRRKGFAESAKWMIERWNAKEQRNEPTYGFSIRFAETALQAWSNVDVSATIAFEDETKRLVRITVTDLETNISFTDEVVLMKTVERSRRSDKMDIIAERTNSQGKTVFIVRATEDELLQKVNSAKSKSIRTSGLRLIPQDILDEAWDECDSAIEKGGKDSALETKKICDAFQSVGVQPSELEAYIGHSLRSISPQEIKQLRGIFAAIRDGEKSWKDYAVKGDSSETAKNITPAMPFSAPRGATEIPAPTAAAKEADDIPMDFPKQEAKPDPKPEAPSVAPHERLQSIISDNGLSFDAFVGALKAASRLDDAAEPADMSELPAALVGELLSKSKATTALIRAALNAGGAK